MKRFGVFSSALLMCLSFSLSADEMPMTFDELDGDGSGYISKEEANKRSDLAGRWSDADKNDDGKLDVSEFSAFEVRMVPPDDMEDPEPGAAPTR